MINMQVTEDSFEHTYDFLRSMLLDKRAKGKSVDTGHWQALRGVPHTQTYELERVNIEMPIAATPGSWAAFLRPNLPWAEDHFNERIGGEPLNPGVQFQNWPWYRGGVEDHKAQGHFSHSYMERFWPKRANASESLPQYYKRQGIRYPYGDLETLIQNLKRDPHTRQAYLPIWFPEDLSAAQQDQRVPCSLGYHFMLRDSRLHCMYPMRSVDFVRYLRDDLYMAGRLVQWIIASLTGAELNDEDRPAGDSLWMDVMPGKLMINIGSLHCFDGDVAKLTREHLEYTKGDPYYGAAV